MAAYVIDVIEGNGGTVDLDGYTGNRVAIVQGFLLDGYARLGEAINAVGIEIGDQHPFFTDSACQTIAPESISSDIIRITYGYVPMIGVPPKFNVGASTVDQDTNLDKLGNAINVSYTYPSDYQNDPAKADKTETIGKIIASKQPIGTIVIKKREKIIGGELITKAALYVGKLNQAGWNLRPVDDARRWLCTGITGELIGYYNDGVEVKDIYDVTYTFEDNGASGWDVSVVFLDPTTGEPPDPTTWSAHTSKKIEVNTDINFDPLTVDVI